MIINGTTPNNVTNVVVSPLQTASGSFTTEDGLATITTDFKPDFLVVKVGDDSKSGMDYQACFSIMDRRQTSAMNTVAWDPAQSKFIQFSLTGPNEGVTSSTDSTKRYYTAIATYDTNDRLVTDNLTYPYVAHKITE